MAQPETPENACVLDTPDSFSRAQFYKWDEAQLSFYTQRRHTLRLKKKKAILLLLTKDANQMALADRSLFLVLHNFPCRKYFMCPLNSFFHGTLLNFWLEIKKYSSLALAVSMYRWVKNLLHSHNIYSATIHQWEMELLIIPLLIPWNYCSSIEVHKLPNHTGR